MTILTEAIDELGSLVAEAAAPGDIVAAAMSTGSLLIAEGTAVATVHPLGFVQVKLGSFEEFSLRFHLWPVPRIPPLDPVWMVHRHGWLLRSFVLQGGAVNSEFDVEEKADGDHRIYGVTYSENTSTLTGTPALVAYEETSQQSYDAPASYEVPSTAFHATVSASDRPTATFVVVYSRKDSSPLVIGDADGRDSYVLPRRKLSSAQTQEALRQAF